MYFLLDKDYALNNIVRCVGISVNPFTDDEIKLSKETYNTKETIVFIGDDIPHHIEFDSTLNTIVEKLPVEEEVATLSVQDEVVEEPKVFNEDVETEAGTFYFYIDKNIADTEYRTETIATFTKPLLNPKEYLQKEVYEVKGTDIPFYITVENGKVRESTKYEQYLRGQYKLQEREVAFKKEIICLEEGWYIENNELIKVERPDDMVKPVFNETTHNWVETASNEEKKEKYYSLINGYKSEILDTGYTYVDTEEKEHQQKCRDKDLALLGNCISAHEDIATFSNEELKTTWAFNDGDILEMNLSELKKLRLQGAMFVQTVFNVEAVLKGLDSNIKLTKNEFIELINENSNIKCWSY